MAAGIRRFRVGIISQPAKSDEAQALARVAGIKWLERRANAGAIHFPIEKAAMSGSGTSFPRYVGEGRDGGLVAIGALTLASPASQPSPVAG